MLMTVEIKQGQTIGYVGDSGLATAPHLHYEVWYKDQAVNPINFYYGDLTPEEFQEMLLLSWTQHQKLKFIFFL